MKRFYWVLIGQILCAACIPSPEPPAISTLWSVCQGAFDDCAEAIDRTVGFDEVSFERSPPFVGDPSKSAAANRSFTPPESPGPRVKRLIQYGLWYLARTPVQTWSFTEAEMKRSPLRESFHPPLWRNVIQAAQKNNLDFRLALFDWLLKYIGEFRFEAGDPAPDHIARYDFFGKNELGQVAFNARFITGVRSMFPFVEGITAGSVILHEATHGAVTVHGGCVRDPAGSCDNTLNGPYGMEILYALAVMKAAISDGPGPGNDALAVLAQRTCVLVRDHVNFLPKEYWQVLGSDAVECSVLHAVDWFKQLDSALSIEY